MNKLLSNVTAHNINYTIIEIIQILKIPIDKFIMDNFWWNLHDDIPIYLSLDMLKWMGYDDLKNAKQRIKTQLIEEFKENKHYWFYDNKEYNEKFLPNCKKTKYITYPEKIIITTKNTALCHVIIS